VLTNPDSGPTLEPRLLLNFTTTPTEK
jgi:hypothetical protein